jgi:hypothetical protein
MAEEYYTIDATINVESLSEAIKLVKSVDGLSVISVRQGKKKSGGKYIMNDGTEINYEIDDPNTLIIQTGKVRGPLDGGGKYHLMIRENNKWIITKTTHWVS